MVCGAVMCVHVCGEVACCRVVGQEARREVAAGCVLSLCKLHKRSQLFVGKCLAVGAMSIKRRAAHSCIGVTCGERDKALQQCLGGYSHHS